MAETPIIPIAGDPGSSVAAPGTVPTAPVEATERLWQRGSGLSSAASMLAGRTEHFLGHAGFVRAPWLAVVFAGGILSWFALSSPWQWVSAMAIALLAALAALALWRDGAERDHVRQAVIAAALVFAAGMGVIWLRAEMVGAAAIGRPVVERIQGYVLDREDQPADDRLRLTLAVRDVASGEGRKIRVNVPLDTARAAEEALGVVEGSDALAEGAVVRMRVRLMPPASPMMPGAYNFARAAWFMGLSATGSAVGEMEIIEPAPEARGLAGVQRAPDLR